MVFSEVVTQCACSCSAIEFDDVIVFQDKIVDIFHVVKVGHVFDHVDGKFPLVFAVQNDGMIRGKKCIENETHLLVKRIDFGLDNAANSRSSPITCGEDVPFSDVFSHDKAVGSFD